MKNKKNIFVSVLILGIFALTMVASSATVLLPQNPSAGSVLIGSSTVAYKNLASSTPGYVLTATSTPPYVTWALAAATGITSLNGSTSSSQEFASSGPALSISSSDGVHTFILPTSTASQTGVLLSTDWTTFNNKQPLISFPIPVASTSLSAITPLVLSSNTISIPTSTTAQDGFLTATDWNTFNGKQDALTNPVIRSNNYKSIQWSASYTTSTSVFDDPVFTFRTTSTIHDIYVSNRDATSTLSWNFVYSTDPTTATSSAFKLLSSTQVTTSTPTSAVHITSFASSTPGLGQTLRMYSENASSSITTFTIWYTED